MAMNKRQIVILASLISFFVPTSVVAYKIARQIAARPPASGQPVSAMASLEIIQNRVNGYETVLSKEPQNAEAIEGLQLSLEDLANNRIAADDYLGAVPVLERLIKEHPDRNDYSSALIKAKEKLKQKIKP
jgi:hypothetical protein